MVSVTRGLFSNASMLQQTIGLPMTDTSCLGLLGSNRVPKPAASTTATTGTFWGVDSCDSL